MIARGNVRTILRKIEEIQDRVGNALHNHHNDRNQNAHRITTEELQKVLELCHEITGMYDPLPMEKQKKGKEE